MQIKVTRGDFDEEILEDGSYPAVLKEFDEFDGQFGPRLIWKFDVTADGETLEKVGFTSYSHSDKGYLVQWSQAIMGELPDEFDLDDLLGKPCLVVIETYTNKDNEERNKVSKVKPPRKAKAKKRPAQERPAQERPAEKPKETEEEFDEENFDEIPF